MYWRHAPGGGWKVFGLYGEQPLDPQAPVAQLSYFEAEACARWAGARLPTEAEWKLLRILWRHRGADSSRQRLA